MSALHATEDDPEIAAPEAGIVEQFRCSLAQQRFWILEQLDPGSPALNIAVRWRLEGRLAHDVLEQAWRLLLARHQTLRTGFGKASGEALQIVAPEIPFAIPIVDLTRLEEEQARAEAERLARQEARASFNVAVAPLIRVTRLQLPQDIAILLVTAHHLVCDGWSVGILAREMGEICAALQAGRTPVLPEPAVSYGEFAEWQRACLAEAAPEADDSFWTAALKSTGYFEVPPDRPRPLFQTAGSAIQSRLLDRGLTDALVELARRKGCTLFMTALAGLLAMLHRRTGESDITIGTQTSGRDEVELEEIVGLFINTLVLRTDLGGDPSFDTLMDRVCAGVTEAFEHRQMPFERLIERLNPGRDLSRNALFSVNFIFQRSFIANAAYGGFRLVDLPSCSAGALYDLNFFMVERPEGWRMSCEHNVDLFDAATVEDMLRHWEILLRAALRMPQTPVSALPVLSEEERRRLTVDGNRTEADYPCDKTFIEMFARQVESTPLAPAVVCGPATLFYGDLDARAKRLAGALRDMAPGPRARIGILLERSPDLVIALLATMQAGAAYVPLDPGHPRERLARIVESAGLAGVVTTASLRSLIDRDGLPILDLESDRAAIDDRSAADLPPGCGPEDEAYVIHTSGSTGQPKGVIIRHRSLLNLLWAMRREPGLGPEDRLLAVTTIGFDIAGLEIFLPLLAGATVVLARDHEAADGQELQRLLARHRITVMQATPARWQMLIDAGWDGDPPLRMWCGGEKLPRRLAQELLRRSPELWNLYGPTETTIWSSAGRVIAGDGPVPLGPPIANTQFYILDRHGEPVPQGWAGELHIGGDGLAAGYVGQEELTGQRFLPDRFRGHPGARIYRTGDVMRRRRDGGYEFLGRTDRQIKLRGFRIEPDEIEQSLCRHPDIAQAAVIALPGAAEELALAAYIVARRGWTGTSAALIDAARGQLIRLLPPYMHPTSIQVLDQLPLTPNGKIDLEALLPPGGEEPRPLLPPRALSGPEQRLARIWQDVLGVKDVSPKDDFFNLGGNSLLAARLLARIRAELGRNVGLAALFKAPRLEDMAELLQRGRDRDLDFRRVVKLRANAARPAIIAVNNTGIFYELSKALGPEQPFTALQVLDPDHAAALAAGSFSEIAGAYVSLIREVQPQGPYVLLGWCIGGALAFEAARRLAAEGEAVPLLILADGWVPGYLRRMGRGRAVLAETSYRVQMLLWNVGTLASGGQSLAEFLAARRLLRRVINPFGATAATEADAARADLPAFFPEGYEQSLHARLAAAAKAYDPRPFEGRALLLRSAQQPTGFPLDATLGWADFIPGGVEAATVAGDHFTMLRHPGVGEMAARIGAKLREVLGSV